MTLKVNKEVGGKRGNKWKRREEELVGASAVQEKVGTRKRAEEQPLQNDRKGSLSKTKNCICIPQQFLEGAAQEDTVGCSG